MRVTICSSSKDLISDEYKKNAIKVCEFLASRGYDLNWGSASTSIMGICYDEFVKQNRNIYGYTSKKYTSEIDKLPKATHNIYETTFDLKKNLFSDADVIVFLPGGIGTISEFFAYLEEARSNDDSKTLILYNEDHHFDKTIELTNDLVKRNFNDSSIYEYFKVVNSLDEFKAIIDNLK